MGGGVGGSDLLVVSLDRPWRGVGECVFVRKKTRRWLDGVRAFKF